MIISSIIKRYSNTCDSSLNIVMTKCDNQKFVDFLSMVLLPGSNILSLEDTLFGNLAVDLIICNNKINYLDDCGYLSYFLHCPILIIDHETKPGLINNNIIEYQSNSIYNIALDHKIFNSWGQRHNLVLKFDPKSKSNIEQWRNVLYQITKIPFSLKPKSLKHEEKN